MNIPLVVKSFIFIILLFSVFLPVYGLIVLYDDFYEGNDYWWYDMHWLDYVATFGVENDVSYVNLTVDKDLNEDGISTSEIVTREEFENVNVEICFKLVNYSYGGIEDTFFAFWFYKDGQNEFDIEIGFYPPADRNLTISTYLSDGLHRTYILSPTPLADGNWHVIRLDWNRKVNITVDGVLLLTNWIMPESPMQFWIGAFTKSNHNFNLLVDYVSIENNLDTTENSGIFDILTNPLTWIPIIFAGIIIGLARWLT